MVEALSFKRGWRQEKTEGTAKAVAGTGVSDYFACNARAVYL